MTEEVVSDFCGLFGFADRSPRRRSGARRLREGELTAVHCAKTSGDLERQLCGKRYNATSKLPRLKVSERKGAEGEGCEARATAGGSPMQGRVE